MSEILLSVFEYRALRADDQFTNVSNNIKVNTLLLKERFNKARKSTYLCCGQPPDGHMISASVHTYWPTRKHVQYLALRHGRTLMT